MKNKLIIVTALLAVMFASTGIAAAFTMEVNKAIPNQNVFAGNPILVSRGVTTFSLQTSSTVNDTDMFNITEFNVVGIPTATIALNAPPLVLMGGNFHLHPNGADPYIAANAFNVNIPASAPNGTLYTFTVGASGITPIGPGQLDSASLSRTLQVFIPPANISGMKFNDLNHNGIKDVGEPGLVGWTITLKDKNTGATIAITTTDGSGNYKFNFIPAGTYSIDETQQAGWTQSAPTPIPPGNYSVILTGVDQTGFDFGNYLPLANISGMKFNDSNNNGINDGEQGLQGWVITLRNGSGAIVGTTTTDASGKYNFTGLMPDTYTVSETQQAGWTQTAPKPVPPGTYTQILNGVDVTGLDFGNFKPIPVQGPGKVVGWGNLGSKGSFNLWVYSAFMPNGVMEFTDKINNVVIKATRIDSVTTDKMSTPKTGTITGMATLNGAGPYAFTVQVVDAADPGAGKDMFTIDVSSPTPYHNSGTLTMGDITVVK